MSHSNGKYTEERVSKTPIDINSDEFLYYKKTIPHFEGEAVYVYSFKKNRMVYAAGWFDILGYKDEEMNLLTFINSTSEKYKDFANELNDNALKFLSTKTTDLEKYSFTLELEKIHKNGHLVPLFSRVGVFKATDGKVEEIIGISQTIKSLRYGDIMQFAAYGPEKSEFEETLSKELFRHYVISRKEKEALQLAAEGYAFKEIAHQLGVSQSAIEKRIIPMYKRFGVKSLPHLINFAHKNHLL